MSTTIQPKARWMLVVTLVAGLAGVFAAPAAARADEVVRTNMEASLRARPGERAPTLAHLDEGQPVRVLGRQGRWLKVSVKGKVGWITRTQVADDAEPVSARATADKKRTVGAKARKKGWSSRDEEAVGADAVDAEDDEEQVDDAAADDTETAQADEGEDDEEAPAKASKKDKEETKGMKAKKVAAKPRKKQEKIAKGGEVVALRTTAVHAKPSKKSDEKWDADKGATMTVVAINEQGDWIKVKDESGDKGWVASKDLQARSSGDDEEDSDSGDAIARSSSGDDGSDGLRQKVTPMGPMSIWVSANVGVLSKQQTYTSEGQGLRANYGLANTAPAVIGAMGVMRHMGKVNLGIDGAVTASIGGDGIAIGGDTAAMNETLGWKALQIEVHGSGQYVLSPKGGYALSARAGYHVSSVTVDYSTNAKLPSEKLSGFTVGAGFEAPRLTEKLGMHVAADYMLGAELKQTEGVKDGDTSTATAMFLSAGASYAFTAKLGMSASYQMAIEGFGFAGTNQRQTDATNAQRKDLQHVFGVGLAYSF